MCISNTADITLQTLGVGASFNFDYEDVKNLTLDEYVHVLRARAALSAVKRVRYLFDPDRARAELKEFDTLVERNNARKKLVKEAEEETFKMAEMVKR